VGSSYDDDHELINWLYPLPHRSLMYLFLHFELQRTHTLCPFVSSPSEHIYPGLQIAALQATGNTCV
jgi:hypothetical protein